MKNFNEISRKYVTYIDIESHKKTKFHPHSTKHIFGKTTRGWGSIAPPPPPHRSSQFFRNEGINISTKITGHT